MVCQNYKEIKKGQLDLYTIFIASRHFTSIDDFINLELCCSRCYGNMTKFHYNPIPLTSTTREFFDHLQKLYIYSRKDNQFEEDKRIIKREKLYLIWAGKIFEKSAISQKNPKNQKNRNLKL